MGRTNLTIEAELEILQRGSFSYFVHEKNPANRVGIERGFLSRSAALERTLATLCFFWNSPHGPEPDAAGYLLFS